MLGDPFKTERSGTSGETIITIHSALENLSAEWFANYLKAHCSGTAERLRYWSCG